MAKTTSPSGATEDPNAPDSQNTKGTTCCWAKAERALALGGCIRRKAWIQNGPLIPQMLAVNLAVNGYNPYVVTTIDNLLTTYKEYDKIPVDKLPDSPDSAVLRSGFLDTTGVITNWAWMPNADDKKATDWQIL